MQPDPTAIMLDQLMRVVVMTSIQAVIYGIAAYFAIKKAIDHA